MAEVHLSPNVAKMVADLIDGVSMDARDALDELSEARVSLALRDPSSAALSVERGRSYIREIRAKLYEGDPRLDPERARALALRMRTPRGDDLPRSHGH